MMSVEKTSLIFFGIKIETTELWKLFYRMFIIVRLIKMS